MKKLIKYSSFLLLTLFLATSCDDTNVGDDEELNYNTGINVVQFTTANVTAPALADGEIKNYTVKLLAAGPDLANVSGDALVTFSVDPASTAVEGVNYNLGSGSNTVTLSDANDYLGTIPISIITEGIDPPVSKTLILNIESISGTGDNLVVSGNKAQIIITIAYSCFSDLAGTYTNPAVPQCDAVTGPGNITVTEESTGRYLVSSMTGYTFGAGNCISFFMTDICGVLTYDGGDLEANNYSGAGGAGVVNPDGSFTITLKLIEAGYSETSTYTPL